MVYETGNWQGFLEQIIRLLSRHGYSYFSLSQYPSSKFYKWGEIDKKLIAKYNAGQTSMQRYRARKKGLCSYYFIRWNQYAIVFKSTGQGMASLSGYFEMFLQMINSLLTTTPQHSTSGLLEACSMNWFTIFTYLSSNMMEILRTEVHYFHQT